MLKRIFTASIIFTSLNCFAKPQTICGPTDDRRLSFEPTIGRLSEEDGNKGCTVTLIGNSCALTAGHCKRVLIKAEFNTPESYDGKPMPSAKEDVYYIDQGSIISQDDGPGKDWAVLKFTPNQHTGKLPGQVQGYKNVSFEKLKKDLRVRITGYGYDSKDSSANFAQQTHTGRILSVGGIFFDRTVLSHTVDTMGGNSGSTIVNENTQEVVGIHTHGGCRKTSGSNRGTIISRHKELKEAIYRCLVSE